LFERRVLALERFDTTGKSAGKLAQAAKLVVGSSAEFANLGERFETLSGFLGSPQRRGAVILRLARSGLEPLTLLEESVEHGKLFLGSSAKFANLGERFETVSGFLGSPQRRVAAILCLARSGLEPLTLLDESVEHGKLFLGSSAEFANLGEGFETVGDFLGSQQCRVAAILRLARGGLEPLILLDEGVEHGKLSLGSSAQFTNLGEGFETVGDFLGSQQRRVAAILCLARGSLEPFTLLDEGVEHGKLFLGSSAEIANLAEGFAPSSDIERRFQCGMAAVARLAGGCFEGPMLVVEGTRKRGKLPLDPLTEVANLVKGSEVVGKFPNRMQRVIAAVARPAGDRVECPVLVNGDLARRQRRGLLRFLSEHSIPFFIQTLGVVVRAVLCRLTVRQLRTGLPMPVSRDHSSQLGVLPESR
jgi:hypothetical protein